MATTVPTCTIDMVTPEMAKQWLGLNHRNRRLAEPQVRRIAGAIQRDEWMVSTDAIGLDVDGGVVNGQHRLTAIIETDTSVPMLVLRNVDPNIIRVIDQGTGRNFTQLLRMDGRYTDEGVIALAIEWLHRVINDLEVKVPTALKPTTPQLLDLFEKHPNITRSTDIAKEVGKLGLNKNIAAALHYLCATVDQDGADRFFERLATGLEVEDGDPAYALREKVIANAKKTQLLQAKPFMVGAWTIKAWEANRRGETVVARNLNWVPSSRPSGQYPKVSDVPWMVTEVAEAEDGLEA